MNYEGYKRQFYVKIANASNYTTKEAAEQLYNGMVRVIIDGLRTKGRVYLPGLGEFKITEASPVWSLNSKRIKDNVGMTRVIKFQISQKFKAFVKGMQ